MAIKQSAGKPPHIITVAIGKPKQKTAHSDAIRSFRATERDSSQRYTKSV